ncbi:MAG: hypothetical protein FWE07_06755 [Turicibacter sp.]|nr:hypothetical protein [Turicibacter sp.]
MENKIKVITICGSLRFQEQMIMEADRLELEGNCVLSVVYPSKAKELYTTDEIEQLQKMHFKRIDMSDAIYVVNIDGYIGEATRQEISYAESIGKEILYYGKYD